MKEAARLYASDKGLAACGPPVELRQPERLTAWQLGAVATCAKDLVSLFLGDQESTPTVDLARITAATNEQAGTRPAVGPTEYFEVPIPQWGAVCSDLSCPCPETPIPPGKGFLYISPDVVEFRREARSEGEAMAKLELLRHSREAQTGAMVLIDPKGIAVPVLICEQGARLRPIDLETAAADARHWWESGQVPLRVTPARPSTSLEGVPPQI